MHPVFVRPLHLVVALLAPATACFAAIDITLTMDDLPEQPVHGLVHPSGVQFEFTVDGRPSVDASYASNGPGAIVFVQDPSIEGTSRGILSITFPLPTPVLRFGVARLADSTTAAVELFDADNASLGVTNVTLTPTPAFAEGQFIYSGTPAKRATIRFVEPESRFAFDNLFFRVVPEPASYFALVIGGLIFWAAGPMRRRNH